jgi:hypothetical protein
VLNFAWMSADGGWAAAFVTHYGKSSLTGTTAMLPDRGEILVWDLWPLRPASATGTPTRTPAGSR